MCVEDFVEIDVRRPRAQTAGKVDAEAEPENIESAQQVAQLGVASAGFHVHHPIASDSKLPCKGSLSPAEVASAVSDSRSNVSLVVDGRHVFGSSAAA
jgi:hypothetical protein